MTHSVEIEVYVLGNAEDVYYNEVPLEIQFTVDDTQSSEIVGTLIDGKDVELADLYDSNPSLDDHIDHAIGEYVLNLE